MNSRTGCRSSSHESTMLRTCGVRERSLGERRKVSSVCACAIGRIRRLRIVVSREKGSVDSKFMTLVSALRQPRHV